MTQAPSLDYLLRLTAEANDVSVDDLKSLKRVRSVAWPRQMFVMLARDMTKHSLPKIGRFLNLDHTGVRYSERRARDRLAICATTKGRVEAITKRVEADMNAAAVQNPPVGATHVDQQQKKITMTETDYGKAMMVVAKAENKRARDRDGHRGWPSQASGEDVERAVACITEHGPLSTREVCDRIYRPSEAVGKVRSMASLLGSLCAQGKLQRKQGPKTRHNNYTPLWYVEKRE